jgi:DNA-binding CsgD family transcriptional regulator
VYALGPASWQASGVSTVNSAPDRDETGCNSIQIVGQGTAPNGCEGDMPAEPIFADRIDERQVLADLAESARRGDSGALVVYGEVGMGKTALLDLAVSVSDLPVSRISGVEAEHAFGFAALHRLFVPFMDRVRLLPAPQRMALESAFGLLEASPPDRFLVGLAGLGVVAAEAAESGLLCVVDDAQWIDLESLQTLAFIGRRLRAESVVLLFGLRTEVDLPPALAGIPTLEVGGLPHQAALDVLTHATARSMSSAEARRVVRETGGCPLALWELGKELAETHSTNGGGPLEHLPISHRLQDHFSQQVGRLSPDAQLLLLVAATETSGDRALVWTVARRLGCGVDAEMEAERLRLLLPGPEIRFRHPLIRSAVYARADPRQRRTVHQALAEALPQSTYPDRWAHHLAFGAAGPSEHLAGELEAMSQLAQARGGYSAQTDLLVHAARLSETLEARSVRLLNAAAAAFAAGTNAYAADLLDQAEPHLLDSAAIAEAQYLRGLIAIPLSQNAKAPALLLAAARSFLPLSTKRAREALFAAFTAYMSTGRFTVDLSPHDIAAEAEKTRPLDDPPTVLDHLLDGTTAFYSTGPSRAYEHYRRAADLVHAGKLTADQVAQYFVVFVGWVWAEVLDDWTYSLWMARTEAYARQHGALYLLVNTLVGQMFVDVRAGRLPAAASRLTEAHDLATAIGQPAEFFLGLDVLVRAWAGDEEGTQAAATAYIEINTALGIEMAVLFAHWALAVLHLGAARYEEALAETDFLRAQTTIGFTTEALPLAVEAAVRAGQIDKARRALADLEPRALASGTPWALGLLARSRALLTNGPEAETYYLEALWLLQQTTVATDVGRTRLVYGEWLRRQRRRRDARTQLRLAHDFFAEIGAIGFAQRAENELLATGERSRPRSVEHALALTPQERRVAELASNGLSNQEIASQLFISTATVDYHLRKVYRKLNIRSRVRLKTALEPAVPSVKVRTMPTRDRPRNSAGSSNPDI